MVHEKATFPPQLIHLWSLLLFLLPLIFFKLCKMCLTVESLKRIIWNIFQKHEDESVGSTTFIHPFMNPSLNTYVLSIYYVQGAGDPKERLPLGQEAPLEKRAAALQHPCWRIPRTEEPGGHSAGGPSRVRHCSRL